MLDIKTLTVDTIHTPPTDFTDGYAELERLATETSKGDIAPDRLALVCERAVYLKDYLEGILLKTKDTLERLTSNGTPKSTPTI